MELLVVITIIAILAGITLPVMAGVRKRSRVVGETNPMRKQAC